MMPKIFNDLKPEQIRADNADALAAINIRKNQLN